MGVKTYPDTYCLGEEHCREILVSPVCALKGSYGDFFARGQAVNGFLLLELWVIVRGLIEKGHHQRVLASLKAQKTGVAMKLLDFDCIPVRINLTIGFVENLSSGG